MKKTIIILSVILILGIFAVAKKGPVPPPFPDTDEDGVGDSKDLCPGTVLPESIPDLESKHYADIDGDKIFETEKKGTIVDSKYTLVDTYGCSCEQILDQKSGDIEDELESGCTSKTIKTFIRENKKS